MGLSLRAAKGAFKTGEFVIFGVVDSGMRLSDVELAEGSCQELRWVEIVES